MERQVVMMLDSMAPPQYQPAATARGVLEEAASRLSSHYLIFH